MTYDVDGLLDTAGADTYLLTDEDLPELMNHPGLVPIVTKLGGSSMRVRSALFKVLAEAGPATEGWDPAFGARPLKRTIQQRVENQLASRILSGEFGPGDTVVVDAQGKSITFGKGGEKVSA